LADICAGVSTARADIDLSALAHNLQQVRRRVPGQKILAMVKSNAYGHGLVACAQALLKAGADALGVACIGEALSLRKAGISAEVVLISGFHRESELPLIFQHRFTVVVHSLWQSEVLYQYAQSATTRLKLWIKIDTGMHRLGVAPADFAAIYQKLASLSCLDGAPGMMTHLACADERDSSMTVRQVQLFEQVTAGFVGERSIANSAGIIHWPCSTEHTHWLRPGIMLYGVSPDSQQLGADYGLRAAMKLSAKVVAIRTIAEGDCVGYGAHWCADAPTRVATLAIGYGDGVPRLAAGTSLCYAGDTLCLPIVGRVSMDLTTVKISRRESIAVGDRLVFWGGGHRSVEQFATNCAAFQYELLTSVSARVARHYINE
jgi:alanine racemase